MIGLKIKKAIAVTINVEAIMNLMKANGFGSFN